MPVELGGDSVKASAYASLLSKNSSFYGDKALAVMAPEGTDLVKYWEQLLSKNNQVPEYQIETGKACMMADDIKNAEKYYYRVIGTDPEFNILMLDLARFHIFKVMKNPSLAREELPSAKSYLEGYLQTSPEPAAPLKAYALGLLSRVEM